MPVPVSPPASSRRIAMRYVFLALLFGLGLAACAEKVPITESQRFACQPPQLADLSNKFVGGLCLQNDIVADLNATGPQLDAAARADYFQHENELTAEPKVMAATTPAHAPDDVT